MSEIRLEYSVFVFLKIPKELAHILSNIFSSILCDGSNQNSQNRQEML